MTQKSELQFLSLTGPIVKAKKQKQPCAKAVGVEAAASTGLPALLRGGDGLLLGARWAGDRL